MNTLAFVALVAALALIYGFRKPESAGKNLVKLFGGSETDALQKATSWAREVLNHHGIATSGDTVAAVRQLRKEKPGLSLLAAKKITDNLESKDTP
jgi:hypothetical protein